MRSDNGMWNIRLSIEFRKQTTGEPPWEGGDRPEQFICRIKGSEVELSGITMNELEEAKKAGKLRGSLHWQRDRVPSIETIANIKGTRTKYVELAVVAETDFYDYLLGIWQMCDVPERPRGPFHTDDATVDIEWTDGGCISIACQVA